jgi:acetyltransferase-like isoleucine patch superfamily enzyme
MFRFGFRRALSFDRTWRSGRAIVFGLRGKARITIGSHTMLGPNVTILTANHGFEARDVLVRDHPENERDVCIGEDAWIGANAVILPGVTIGKGAVVAAGAVVTADVEPFSVVGGVPARIIGTRGSAG